MPKHFAHYSDATLVVYIRIIDGLKIIDEEN
jgi:hypothetical protein